MSYSLLRLKVASDIEFGETPKEQLAVLMNTVNQLNQDINGNGSPGLKKITYDYIAADAAAKAENEKWRRNDRRRLDVILALLGLIIAYLTLVETHKDKSALDPKHIFHSMSDYFLAGAQQLSGDRTIASIPPSPH